MYDKAASLRRPSASPSVAAYCPACAERVETHRYAADQLPGMFWIDARGSTVEAVFANGMRKALNVDLCGQCDAVIRSAS